MKSKMVEFEKEYFVNLIHEYIRWEADEKDLQCYLDAGEYMSFNIIFANDNSVILDAGCYKLYIEWGINECPVYVDIDGYTCNGYTCIGKVRNARFWALVERFKNRSMRKHVVRKVQRKRFKNHR